MLQTFPSAGLLVPQQGPSQSLASVPYAPRILVQVSSWDPEPQTGAYLSITLDPNLLAKRLQCTFFGEGKEALSNSLPSDCPLLLTRNQISSREFWGQQAGPLDPLWPSALALLGDAPRVQIRPKSGWVDFELSAPDSLPTLGTTTAPKISVSTLRPQLCLGRL